MSVAITSYEMGGVGHTMVERALKSLYTQTFKDFEVVVSDQSKDFLVADVCRSWIGKLNIVYCREEYNRGYFTANENWAIKHCAGDIIKFLDADDYLYDENALQVTYDAFDNTTNWVATDYVHAYSNGSTFNRHHPSLNPKIYICNTLGTPSCVAVKNLPKLPLFDENLRWAGDCEWYKRLWDVLGNPKVINNITAVHYLWDGQVENTFGADPKLQAQENFYILNKYEGG